MSLRKKVTQEMAQYAPIPEAKRWKGDDGKPRDDYYKEYNDNLFVPCSLSTNANAPFKNNGFLRALLHGNLPYLGMYANDEQIAKANLVCRLNRQVALTPMLRHSFVGEGYAVQESEFANGVKVRIDLDKASYEIRWADGTVTAGIEQNIALDKNSYAYTQLDR